MSTLEEVRDQLQSTKSRERQEALVTIRRIFQRDSVVARHEEDKTKGSGWLALFQALFVTVRLEKAAYEKALSKSSGPTAAVTKRLEEATSVVRWLTERSVERLSKGARNALLNHLTQTMVRSGRLFEPVVLNYVKTLRCLVGYPPHLAHMDDLMWIDLLKLSLNVILGRSITTFLDDPMEEEDEYDRTSTSSNPDDADLYMDEEPGPSTPRSTKKRRRAESSSPPPRVTKTPSNRTLQPVSLVQIEFTGLLATLLQSSSAPLLHPEHDYLPSAILNGLQEFLVRYPADTSLHQDYLIALSATLSHLELNCRELISKFAWKSWDSLVGIWTTKNRGMKEILVAILKTLLPHVSIGKFGSESDELRPSAEGIYGDGLGKLWHTLDAEAESRWGVELLSQDSLRLQIQHPGDAPLDSGNSPFTARTFRTFWHFDSGQALAWAVLELQADCAEKLYVLSESTHSGQSGSGVKGGGKRIRRDNPIASLLTDSQKHPNPNVRVFRLQTLLFFIDRHWSVLHDGLKQDVLSHLAQLVSHDDSTLQSWASMCLAAIAHDNATSSPSGASQSQTLSTQNSTFSLQTPRTGNVWEQIWTQAIRRTSVSAVCRTASHLAYVLLVHASSLLPSHRVLAEIEAFAKDLDVQGPTFPYDSVCMFITLCLKVANQDVRLYRMQLEDKVITWLTESWRVAEEAASAKAQRGRAKSQMPNHTVSDVLLVLETICSLAKRSNVVCRRVLPEGVVANVMAEHSRTSIIRDYLLYSRLPQFQSQEGGPQSSFAQDRLTLGTDGDLTQSTGRERRISSYLLRSLEALADEWENGEDVQITAERARKGLDFAVLTLYFESVLQLNGTRPNRRTIQAACRLVGLLAPLLREKTWSSEERCLLLLGLETLIAVDEEMPSEDWREAIVAPTDYTGIRRQVLGSLKSGGTTRREGIQEQRRAVQKVIFQSSDVQDTFENLFGVFRDILRVSAGLPTSKQSNTIEVDEADGFGPIRTSQTNRAEKKLDANSTHRHIARICIDFLSLVPILESASGETTRDKELLQIILDADGDDFLSMIPSYSENVRCGRFNLGVNATDALLLRFSQHMRDPAFAKRETMNLEVIRFLDATIGVWLQPSAVDALCKVQFLYKFYSDMIVGKKVRSWRVRYAFSCFMSSYLNKDPWQKAWNDAEVDCSLPSELLPQLGSDEDIRVRFKLATLSAKLLSPTNLADKDAPTVYRELIEGLPTDLRQYEQILTRLLYMGNVMIIGSSVRRGAYFHILEVQMNSPVFTHHIECVLKAVAARMGFKKFSTLFECYSGQIAYSIYNGGFDPYRFPPHLLGYKNLREYAEVAFLPFSLVYLFADGKSGGLRKSASGAELKNSRALFANHCKVTQKTPAQGIALCFPEIVAYQINVSMDSNDHDGLEDELRSRLKDLQGDLDQLLERHVDGIVVEILRGLGDQDFNPDGEICQSLQMLKESDRAVLNFCSISRYRSSDDFQFHEPNLPAFSTATILRSLAWIARKVPAAESPSTTFHILHRMFAEAQDCPLVNEQLRLLNGISVWIASYPIHFTDCTILRTLVQWCTTCMGQFDLVRAAQSMIEWALAIYSKTGYAEARLPDALIAISCAAHDYATSGGEDIITMLGVDLARWIEDQALELCKRSDLKELVLKALPAWPCDPNPKLAALLDNIPCSKLSKILGDTRVSSKFRVVRRLYDFASRNELPIERFAQSDFWRLKNSIPPLSQLLDEDIDAFSSLLVCQQGQISSFEVGQVGRLTICDLHRRLTRKKPDDIHLQVQGPFILSLHEILQSHDPSQIHIAYETLRYIASVKMPEFPPPLIPEGSRELEYLQRYHFAPRTRAVRDLTDLQQPSYTELCKDFPRWITTLCTLLSDILSSRDPFYAQLVHVLETDVSFAEQSLPVLVHSILQDESKGNTSSQILSQYFTSVLSQESASMSCLKCIVDVVLHLRHFRPAIPKDALAYDKWLKISFRLLASTAITCGAYTTALLFLELAAEHDVLTPSEDPHEETILFDIYSHIDEPDGFYGIKTQDLRRFLVKRFHHEKQWDKSFRFHGAAVEAGSNVPSEVEGVFQSLHAFGFHNLAMNALQSAPSATQATFYSSEMAYHLGWRTETWDLPSNAGERNSGAPLYHALRAIYRERDNQSIDNAVRQCCFGQMEQLRALGDENLFEIRQIAQNLMCLNQVRHWRTKKNLQDLAIKQVTFRGWAEEGTESNDFDFTVKESILATRISLIRSVREKEEREQIGNLVTPFVRALVDVERSCLLSMSKAARESLNLQVALNSVVRAQALEQQPSSTVSQEYADVLWLHNERKLAVQYLKDLVVAKPKDIHKLGQGSRLRNALLLARLGEWVSEACLEKPTDILSNFFEPAVASLETVDSSALGPERATIYSQCARFAEQQYHTISKSPDSLRWKLYVDRKAQQINSIKSQITRTQLGSKEYAILAQEQKGAEKLLKQDTELVDQHNRAINAFLDQAIDMHSKCLEATDAFDDDGAIRMCSLWFANFENPTIQQKISVALNRTPSRKLVFLAHQLSARVTKTSGATVPEHQVNLQTLIVRMCKEHPFHSLYQVYCLKADHAGVQTNRRRSTRHESSPRDRAAAATSIFDQLRSDKSVTRIVCDVECVSDACLEWAKHPIKQEYGSRSQKPKSPFPVPETMAIRNLKPMKVPVITLDTPLDPTLKYADCVWILRFEPTFETAGGVNLPKITMCVGSDGLKYKQLFKGEGADDIRQDAVMEQVFQLVNVILSKDRETKRRNLRVRSYKVIPLASQAGILEFVQNTTPLQAWLSGAHPRYRPQDMKPTEASALLSAVRKEGGNPTSLLLKAFADIQKRFKPVMRHYFTHLHKAPTAWFAIRLNYARSVATTSIVGHVLGLGDRHTSNILMDNGTGEVVHIDLGIAFDQGKLLPIPERVPFRLTGDMKDGLGISGVQGVFQRCAEETLRVLRAGSDVIMTVLEVFKHDPLHSWTASEIKFKNAQHNVPTTVFDPLRLGIGIDMESNTADEAADRALSSVSRKLDKSLSVEYTVNQLVADAMDSVNLSHMYSGWGPHF